MPVKQNILVIYDQLDAELQYHITQDRSFLQLHSCILNGDTTSEKIQDLAYFKLFDEDGTDKIEWKSMADINSESINTIDKIVTIACLP